MDAEFFSDGMLTNLIITLVVALLAFWLFKISYVKSPPNIAFIISGLSKEPRILVGKGGIRIPFFERIDQLYQGQISVDIKTDQSVPTNDFINVRVDAVAKVCVMKTPEGMRLAAKNFLNLSPEKIALELTDSLQGNMREIVGTLDLKSLNTDRDGFSDQVVEKASKDMEKLGITILSCNIQNITDEDGLIKDLGADNTWRIKKDAANQKAVAQKEISVVQSQNQKEANDARVKAETEIAIKNNELDIKKAELKRIADTKKAEADAAYEIQHNEQLKTVNEKTVEAEIARTVKEQQLTIERVKVRQNELEAEINKKAEADKFETERKAEAEMEQRKRLADAQKYEAERQADARKAQAEADLYTALKEAEGIKAKGDAEAYAIRQKGEAEAAAMEKKAEAYKKYNDAAVTQMIIERLPEMTESVARQVAAIKSVNIYGNNAEGVSSLTSSAPSLVKQTIDLVKNVTGYDLTKKENEKKTEG